MYGYLTREGVRLRCFEERIGGLEVVRLQVPEWGSEERQERRGVHFLRRVGVHRLLNGVECVRGVLLSDTGGLYRKMAAEIGLYALQREHIKPQRAVVGICANRWSRELALTCERLAGQVQALALSIPTREDCTWRLQREYGIPVLTGEGDITLCFAPATARAGRILLGERRPQVEGLRFVAEGLEVPEDCPRTPLLAALVETGHIRREQIRVQPEE